MAAGTERAAAGARATLAAVGALAGVSGWLLSDVLDGIIFNPQAYLLLCAFAATGFGTLLGMLGPLRAGQAVPVAAGLAAVVAALLTLASLRHATLEGFFAAPFAASAAMLLSTMPVPFAMAAFAEGTARRRAWRQYPALFSATWGLAVRYGAAWLFVGLVWAMVYLSDALLQLVGLRVIEHLLDLGPVPWVITGLSLGLALAVLGEMSDTVSPLLVLRLLRLPVPVVLAVVLVFLVAVPVRGLSQLFGNLSAAGTLLAVSLGAVTLVSTAVDARDSLGVGGRLMRRATQALALTVVATAGLAAWAVALRVGQYGWTPPRVAAGLTALVLLGYGLLYAAAVVRSVVLRRGGWMARIREVNIGMALVVMALAALWLTPVLDAERISARNQLARFAEGRTPLASLDLWALREDWGIAGQAALAALRVQAAGPDGAALAGRLAALDAAGFRGAFAEDPQGLDRASLRDGLAAVLPVLPPGSGADWIDRLAGAARPDELRDWIAACARRTAAGHPGCALVVGVFLPAPAGEQAIVIWRDAGDSLRRDAFAPDPAGGLMRFQVLDLPPDGAPAASDTRPGGASDRLLDALATGEWQMAPARLQALHIGGQQMLLVP